jgi:hypothetical protein
MRDKRLANATIISLGAILEALPPKVEKVAAERAREFLEAGLADDPETERLVRGIFLLAK